MDITITGNQILAILGVIVTLGAVEAVITRWLKPFKTLKKSLENKADKEDFEALQKKVNELEAYQNEDHRRIKNVEEGQMHLCKAMLAMVDHSVSGNSIDKLKQAKEDLQNYLIEK